MISKVSKYICDRCGKEQFIKDDTEFPHCYLTLNGNRYDLCQDCYDALGVAVNNFMHELNCQKENEDD